MSASEVFAQAMEHIPALLLTYLTIFAAYWTLGIINIPRWAGRDAVLDRIGHIDPAGINRQSFSALAVISIVSLFMELLLIRWVTSEIRVFAYFKSFVLIACFLGFGLGCYLTRKRIRIAYTLIPLIALAVLIEVPWDPMRRLIMQLSAFIAWFSDVHMFGRAYFSGLPLWGFVSAAMAVSIVIPVFGLVAVSFVPIGQLVGSYLENSRRGVAAYSINVAASLGGIWVFTLLAWLSTPPWVWFMLLFAGLLLFFARNSAVRRSLLITAAVIGVLFVFGSTKRTWWGEDNWRGARQEELTLKPGDAQVLWSPYQKLTVAPLLDNGRVSRIIVSTNDSWFQGLMDLSDPQTQKEEADFQGAPIKFHQYNLPYRFLDAPPARVLIAGGGMGNDAASAIRNGAGSVDVVEIDPLIVSKGRDIHFEHPYRNPKVNVHVDDARAYLERATGPYDLVVFSILDSHTTTSNYTNIRIDNYVYTLESMQRTRSLMGPNGVFVMSFSMERPWFAQRLKDVLAKAFDKEPLLLRRRAGNFFVISTGNQVEKSLAADPELKAYVDSLEPMKLEPAEPLVDDWPYLYSQHRGIPVIIWVMSLGLIVVCGLAFTRLKQSRGGLNWHLFFLGAAFMLLEVQVISKTALLFGTTWLVNSFVITALLLFILLANLVAAWVPKFPRSVAYAGLFITLVISYLVPANTIFFDSMAVRAGAAMALYCSPVFFAGLVFISSFRETGFAAEAFGSNLLGSLVGGLLDSLSFAIGLNALVLVAAVLYGLSLVSRRAAVPEAVGVTSTS
jgi:spermidine synthase